ncbi:MAG: hypothetical protein U0836_01410 [Pirellulales bacterium]
MIANPAATRWSFRSLVRKAGWLLLGAAWVIQGIGLALFVDSNPYRPVPPEAVRLVPDDACAEAIREGSLVVEVKAFRFTRPYGEILYYAFLATALGIAGLRGADALRPASPSPAPPAEA